MPSLVDGPAGDAYISIGELPSRELVERLVHQADAGYGPLDLTAGPIVNVSIRQDQIA